VVGVPFGKWVGHRVLHVNRSGIRYDAKGSALPVAPCPTTSRVIDAIEMLPAPTREELMQVKITESSRYNEARLPVIYADRARRMSTAVGLSLAQSNG
jgi:hypothetical protein